MSLPRAKHLAAFQAGSVPESVLDFFAVGKLLVRFFQDTVSDHGDPNSAGHKQGNVDPEETIHLHPPLHPTPGVEPNLVVIRGCVKDD